MKLVIAEKLSVALSLAKVLGATKKHDGYLAGGGYLVRARQKSMTDIWRAAAILLAGATDIC